MKRTYEESSDHIDALFKRAMTQNDKHALVELFDYSKKLSNRLYAMSEEYLGIWIDCACGCGTFYVTDPNTLDDSVPSEYFFCYDCGQTWIKEHVKICQHCWWCADCCEKNHH